MRKLLMTLAAVVSAGMFAATSAQAAARWNCEGAEYVCGSGSQASAKVSREDASETTTKRSTRVARTHRQDVASLDDNDAKPARHHARRQVTASVTGDNEPALRRRTRNSTSSGSEGGGSSFSGQASYYWEPQALASGGRFNPNAMTAAHKTLPFGTRVRVTNQRNGQSVEVTINDRGPYVRGRVIDLSAAAAGAINMKGAGVAPVTVAVIGRN